MGLNNSIWVGSREGEEEDRGAAKNISEALLCHPGWSYTPFKIIKSNPSVQHRFLCHKLVLFIFKKQNKKKQ